MATTRIESKRGTTSAAHRNGAVRGRSDHVEEADRLEADEMTPDEAREVFDQSARRYVGMSGEEFLEAYESGKFRRRLDDPNVLHMVHLLPLVRVHTVPRPSASRRAGRTVKMSPR